MFVDSTVEHAAVAAAGLFSGSLALFQYDDTEWCLPAPVPQLPGNGASDNASSDNADVIHVHRIGFHSTGHRSRALRGGVVCPILHRLSTVRFSLSSVGEDV